MEGFIDIRPVLYVLMIVAILFALNSGGPYAGA